MMVRPLARALARPLTGDQSGPRIDFYVDAVAGDDGNGGRSKGAAFATIAKALSVASANQTIGLRGGQDHRYHPAGTEPSIAINLASYGTGKATIDGRQHLDDAVWTAVDGTENCWQTTATHVNATANNGLNTNSWTYHLWFPGDEHGTWKVGGADIAANITAVDAAAGSYTVHQDGSTVQDPRSDTNGTVYVYVVHMPDGGDPNGADISISDRQAIWYFGPGRTDNIRLIGGAGKDFAHSANTPFPVFVDHERTDCNQHGHVGPARVIGTYKAVGRPIPGVGRGDNYGRVDGGGINIYSAIDLTDQDVFIDTVYAENFATALYGHGSTNRIYRDVHAKKVIARNCASVVQFDVVNSTNRTAVIAGTVTIDYIDAVGINVGVNAGGDHVINGGHMVFSANPLDTNQQVVRFNGHDDEVTLRNVTWEFVIANSASWKNNLYARVCDLTHVTPVLILDNCQDLSPQGYKGAGWRGSAYASQIELHLRNGTVIGSIMDQAAGTNYPARLFVEDGCTFGMGNRTGPQIEAALAGAGLVEGTDFEIGASTTIVSTTGAVLSAPGWK